MGDFISNQPIKNKMLLSNFDICENLSEQPFSEFSNLKKNINFIVTTNHECFIECDVVSSPKPIINWYKNDKFYQSHLDNFLDHTDDLINSKNMNTQIGWSNILSKIQIYPNNIGDQFKCEIINPCKSDETISRIYTIPQIVSHACVPNFKDKRFIKPSRKSNVFGIPSYLNAYQSKHMKTPVITAATTMRMEYPGNLITLSCQSEAFPKATNKWELVEGEDENGPGISIDNFDFLKVLDNGDLFFNTTQLHNDVVEMTFRCNASNIHGWESFVSTILLVTEE